MAQIQPIGWLDTFVLSSRLRQVYWERFEGEGDLELIHLLDEDGQDLPILKGEKGWKGAKNFLTRLSAAAAPFLSGAPAEFGAVWIDRLKPEGKTVWSRIDDPEMLRLHVCLAAPPGAWFYCGGEAQQLGVGIVNYVNVAALHSRVNFGNAPCTHLVANVRRPAPED